ncbi:MAG: DNA-protecting protein DprA, partial [Xanthomonadales bacterium]|nr:DNA-protecting protein DprA [Xanthomonadales bacterium]
LIKQGARLVETTDEIGAELAPLAGELAAALTRRMTEAQPAATPPTAPAESELLQDPDYARLWEALGYDPVSQERLLQRTGLPARNLSSMLLMLELHGLIESVAGGRVLRVTDTPPKA